MEDEQGKSILSVRIDLTLLNRLRRAAADQHRTVSNTVRLALDAWLTEHSY